MIAYRKTDDASLRLVDAYMRDIRDSEPLDRKEEAELARQTRNGDELARQRLITANLWFVVSVARDFCGRGLSMSELISEGNLGLLEAAGRFDETRGLKFITYGVWWIRQAILKALAENGSAARPPLSWIEGRRKIGREMARLTQELGREPTPHELAVSTHLNIGRVYRALAAGQPDVSLDAPIFADGEETWGDVSVLSEETPAEIVEHAEFVDVVRECFVILGKREQQILHDYFGLDGRRPMTLEEIGEVLGITRERVRQLRNKALTKLRQRYGEALMEFSLN